MENSVFCASRQRDGESYSIFSVVIPVRSHYVTLRLSGWNSDQRPLGTGVSRTGHWLHVCCFHSVWNLQQGSPSDWDCKEQPTEVTWHMIWHTFSSVTDSSKWDRAHWTGTTPKLRLLCHVIHSRRSQEWNTRHFESLVISGCSTCSTLSCYELYSYLF
jgi:hypothetical protein